MHPVELDDYVIPTNALEAFVNVCVGWINSNLVGALVPGLQRIGKSLAIEYFVANYRRWLGKSVGVVSAEVLSHKGGISEGAFWGDLLRSMKRPTKKRSPEDRRDLFVGRLVEAAARTEKRKVIIFIDEAQLLDDSLFKLLIGVHNELWRIYRIKCVWILVGQPELETVASTFIAEGKRQVVGRFMADTYVFQPLTSITDFKAALECYDLNLCYPVGGPSFTEHFAPTAWEAGYRLASDADMIYGRITQARTDNGLPEEQGMTMQGFTTLMNWILINSLPTLKPGDKLDSKVVDEAIVATNCMIFEQQEALLATA
ncbi:ATP-binding protein [Lysobacter sp. SG-8]|uniref:ATP-binding protein n=1 Tax=Marilutibacter penaei TaxID=2759900 RepID=A0A7W3U2H7_9GAMM|nr:ATP-binding protein [Lysobacter penaei]MBB1087684.1 ATP-binding protein [Lysobacter penaei]